jgi:hypothetical protein
MSTKTARLVCIVAAFGIVAEFAALLYLVDGICNH